MAEEEIRKLIPPQEIERIKINDAKPEFRAYAIGHEGNATFRVGDATHGIGKKTFTWIERAVGWLNDKLNIGTKVFNRHSPDTNDHTGRIPVGEIVGKKLTKIKNITTAIAAFYIYPEYRKYPWDVASIEANIEFVTDDGGQSYPTNVRDITGIALSNSEVDSPGFPGATLLGAVAAFHGQTNIQGAETMTLAELKEEISKNGYAPSKLFTVDELIADNSVNKQIKDEKHNLHEQNLRLQKEVDTLKDNIVKKDNEHAAEVKNLKSMGLQNKASVVLDKISKTRNLTDKQVKFAEQHLGNFSTEATDDVALEEDMKKFLDNQMEDYKAIGELFGVKVDEVNDQNTGDKDKSPLISDLEKKPEFDDELNPKIPDDQNPLIPGSKAQLEYSKAE